MIMLMYANAPVFRMGIISCNSWERRRKYWMTGVLNSIRGSDRMCQTKVIVIDESLFYRFTMVD